MYLFCADRKKTVSCIHSSQVMMIQTQTRISEKNTHIYFFGNRGSFILKDTRTQVQGIIKKVGVARGKIVSKVKGDKSVSEWRQYNNNITLRFLLPQEWNPLGTSWVLEKKTKAISTKNVHHHEYRHRHP